MLYVLRSYMASFMKFLTLGVVWLFILSIPVGYQKTLFNLGYFYIVDTFPVHWTIDKIRVLLGHSKVAVSDMSSKVIDKVDVHIQKSSDRVRRHVMEGDGPSIDEHGKSVEEEVREVFEEDMD